MSALSQSADGVLPVGSFDITILEDGSIFQADNFSLDENATRVKSKSPRGRNSRNRVLVDDATFSADFQLADEDTDAPRPGFTFLVDADRDGVAEPYMIDKPGRTFTQDGEWKCKVSGFACANPLPYVSTAGKNSGALSNVTGGAITSVTFAAALPRDVTLTADSFTATGLPTGLSMSAAGVVTGTPSATGTFYTKVKVTGTRVVRGTTETLYGLREITWTIAAP